MTLLRSLLIKDLRRIRRNPIPILIQVGVSMVLVAVLGLAFGGMGKKGSGMAAIKVAIVDEDESGLTEFLQGAMNSPEFSKQIDARFLDREEAMELINENELSAVLIMPEGFTQGYLDGADETLKLELIKNPAQTVYPAIVEEGMETLVTGLNTLSRNLGPDLREWLEVLDGDDEDSDFITNTFIIAGLLKRTADRFEAARDYLTPPLVTYEKETRKKEAGEGEGSSFNFFSFIYTGMAGMFLLMIANNMTNDIYREARFRTLHRYSTLREGLFIFIAEKMILVVVVTLLAAVVMFIGSALIFQFKWENPIQVATLVVCYAICAAGLTSFIAGVAGTERRADTLNTVIIMGIALLGGSMFPPDQMPEFIRNFITPHLPTAWFVGTVRELQFSDPDGSWIVAGVKMTVMGIVLVAFSSVLFHRRLKKGAAS